MTYEKKLEQFAQLFEQQHNERKLRIFPDTQPDTATVEQGYKFDKVALCSSGQNHGRYMVESRTGDIYGIKSWTQVNKRRWFGTLDTIAQYDWSDYYGRPLPGTDAERAQFERESKIRLNYKKRGRRPKASALRS